MAKADYLDLMAQRVQDTDSRLTSDDFARALRAAVVKYSQDRPRAMIDDVVSTGGNSLALPAGFDATFSRIVSIEYPIGDFPRTLLENESFDVLEVPDGQELRLADAITDGQSARLTWTRPHVVDDVGDTVPPMHLDVVSDWAASLLCHDLAALYSGDSDPTITADAVDHNGKAREFAARSRTLGQRYYDALGIDPKRNSAAGVVVDLDTTGSQGRPRLLHHRRYH